MFYKIDFDDYHNYVYRINRKKYIMLISGLYILYVVTLVVYFDNV